MEYLYCRYKSKEWFRNWFKLTKRSPNFRQLFDDRHIVPRDIWTYWKNCESLILDYLDFHEIKHDDQIGYEEVRAIYLLLLEKNRAHFAEHDIEILMATVLHRYSIESIGHMSEAGR